MRCSPRDGRLAQGAVERDLALAGYAAAPGGYDFPAGPEAPDLEPDGTHLTGFQFAFLIRMRFSCLVDADWACTARFYGRDVEPWPRATIDELSAALSSAMEKDEQSRRETGEDRRAVNLRRAEILGAARAHADDAPGVFTLSVPTGGGKTLTWFDFALRHAVSRKRDRKCDRVIVVIPFTGARIETSPPRPCRSRRWRSPPHGRADRPGRGRVRSGRSLACGCRPRAEQLFEGVVGAGQIGRVGGLEQPRPVAARHRVEVLEGGEATCAMTVPPPLPSWFFCSSEPFQHLDCLRSIAFDGS